MEETQLLASELGKMNFLFEANRPGLTFYFYAVSDFWTTSCERCPRELDKLDTLARDPKNAGISFISICCDKLDGAREMIEEKENPRWSGMRHYFIDANEKETAKEWLGFCCVPFYVAIDKDGNICDSGGAETFDLDQAMLLMGHATFLLSEHSKYEREKPTSRENRGHPFGDKNKEVIPLDRIFALDDEF